MLTELVRMHPLFSDASYLLGVLAYRTGHVKEAIAAFERTLYVDPASAMASFSLGHLYRYEGHPLKARRAFQNALNALEGKPDEEPTRFSEDLSCGYLRAACARSLEQLRDSHEQVERGGRR